MTYLNCSPAYIQESRKNDVKSILTWKCLAFEATEKRDETTYYEDETTDVPWFSFANFCLKSIWE